MSEQYSIRPNSFVGRGRELAELDNALADALAGRGRLVLISGEPGIGKTRLADEVSKRASKLGVCVAWGRCWEGAGSPPYWPLIQVIRALAVRGELASAISSSPSENVARIASLVPEVHPPSNSNREESPSSDPEEARFRLFDSVTTLIRSCARTLPLLLLIDDLHDADQSSLQMLSFAARGLADSRVTLLGTYRDAEVRRSADLSKHIADLLREAFMLPLAGLSQAEVDEFVESRAGRKADAGLIKRLHAATDGNPLFVDGVVRLMLAEGELGREQSGNVAFRIPDGVRASIHRQLASLPERTNSILEAAAAIGSDFESALLQAVCGSDSGELAGQIEPAIAAGIVTTRGGTSFRFSHALVRDSVYGEIKISKRIAIHAKIGEAIENLYSAHLESQLAKLAHHFSEARNVEKAIDYLSRSGRASFAVFAFEEARSHWENALALMDRHDYTDLTLRASILRHLGDEYILSDRARVIEYLEESLTLYEKLGDERQAAWVHSRLGLLYSPSYDLGLGNVQRSVEHTRKAETHIAPRADPHLAAHFYIGKAIICSYADEIDEGIAAARRTMEIGERAGGAAWPYGAVVLAKYLSARGHLAEALRLANLARDRSDSINDARLGSTVALLGSDILGNIGAQRERAAWCIRELSQPRTAHSPMRPLIHGNAAMAFAFLGQMQLARHHAWEAGTLVSCLTYFEGDWSTADQIEETYLAKWHGTGRHDLERGSAFLLCRINRTRGEYARARSFGERALALAKEVGHIPSELLASGELALSLAEGGLGREAAPHLERCRQIIAIGEDWRGVGPNVPYAEALVAAKEDLDLARPYFEAALDGYRRFGLAWREAELFYDWGRALLAAGKKVDAAEKFDAALDVYRRIEAAKPWIDRVMAERERAQRPAANHVTSVPEADEVFRKEGEFWTISYDGRTFRLKDAKGLHYIAHLLSHPGEKFRVHDLVAVVEGPPEHANASARSLPKLEISGDLGDLGPILDDRAKASYRRRRQELREELDEAEDMNDAGRVQGARAELELFEQQLSAAIGLGGRDRKTSSHAERARVVVTRNIRATLVKIEEEHPPLGRHLNSAIKTGYLCTYLPASESTLVWKL
jgi:tetratricopeptide (TPR) repeat protein